MKNTSYQTFQWYVFTFVHVIYLRDLSLTAVPLSLCLPRLAPAICGQKCLLFIKDYEINVNALNVNALMC